MIVTIALVTLLPAAAASDAAWLHMEHRTMPSPALLVTGNNSCGPNCLYMFLRAHGVSVSQEEVLDQVPRNALGASLLDLRAASEHFGVPAKVRHLSFEQLTRGCHLPIIAYCEPKNNASTGHYVVILHIDNGIITFWDGTFCREFEMTYSSFNRRCGGYALVPIGMSRNDLALGAFGLF